MSANVPELRFSGFADPWEQRKLGDIVDVCSGRDYKHLSEGPIPVYGTGGYMTSVSEALEHKRDAVGIGRKGTIDSPYVLRAPFWTVDTLFYCPPKDDVDLDLALCLFLNINWRAKDESTGLPSLSKEAIRQTETFVPGYGEQRAVGALFSRLDSLIALHQRKHNQLSVLKSSLLERMFPKPGSDVPELRFSGFADPWEQRKLGELYAPNNERNVNDQFGYGRTLSIATMTFNGGNGAADSSLATYKVIRIGDIAFEGHTNKEHAYGRFVLNDAGDGLMSPRFTCLRPKVEQSYPFWKQYIPRESMMRPVLINATKSGTMMNELVVDDLMRESILVPSLPEQRAVGALFSRLDSLIALHQRKLEKLRALKQSLLQKMFV